jgi:monoamine oxidase
MGKRLSRRDFLSRMGAVGASLAVLNGIDAITGTAAACPVKSKFSEHRLPDGKGQLVIILGAGVAGLAAALDLTRANYKCVVLELSHRVGGRLFTARRGSRIIQKGLANMLSEQVCKFDEGIHVELGGGRIPFHHRRVVGRWEELGIPYELYAIDCMMAKYQSDTLNNGVPLRVRDLLYSTWGYIAELAGDAGGTSRLLASLSKVERAQIDELLQLFGGLGANGCGDDDFCGTNRFGCSTDPQIKGSYEPSLFNANCAAVASPISFSDLVRSEYWNKAGAIGGHTPILQASHHAYQPGMLQPIDGMDALPRALSDQLGTEQVLLNTEVQRIQLTDDGVEIGYRNNRTGESGSLKGAYCLSSIPGVLLGRIDNNFPEDARAALKDAHTRPAVRFAYQANRRFWQNDENQIYGGMSFLDNPLSEVWYPSSGFHMEKGGLMGGFYLRDEATRVGKSPIRERIAEARKLGSKIHPEILDDAIVPGDLALSLAWQQLPGEEGMVTLYHRQESYERMLIPFGERFFMIGCQAAPLRGWVEGALMSVEHVLQQIGANRATTIAGLRNDPQARYMLA